MRALGEGADQDGRLYFTGRATAVLLGWRPTTIDVNILIHPDQDRLLRAIPELKEKLRINVELACPADFIPELPGWETRSILIDREERLSFFHYAPFAQCLSKIERGHEHDATDVREMIQRKLVDPAELMHHFQQIEADLYRYPALDAASFHRAVEKCVADFRTKD